MIGWLLALPGRLHRDEQGQILPFFILGALAMVMLIALVFNTGEQTARKIQVQNAADAAAISQAAWTARSLNIISMNNTAITQMVALNAAVTAVIPVLIEAGAKAIYRGVYYVRMLATCTVNPACYAWWGYNLADLGVRVLRPLTKITLDKPWRIESRTASLAKALDTMNNTIVNGFPHFAGQVQQRLAEENGLGDEVPRFYAGYGGAEKYQYKSTNLPVEPRTKLELPTLCLAGEFSSTFAGPSQVAFGNLDDHGYPPDEGPGRLARKLAGEAINPPVDALEGFPHYVSVFLDYDTLAMTLWLAACELHAVASPGPTTLTVYRVRNRPVPLIPPLGVDFRQKWSLLAFAHVEHDKGAILQPVFDDVIGGISAYGQAEVYNMLAYDLFTQDWRARLVPARLMQYAPVSRLQQAVSDFPELKQALGKMGTAGIGDVNAH